MKKDLGFILLISIAHVFLLSQYIKSYEPVSMDAPEKVVVIPEGSSLKGIAEILASEGLINNVTMFNILSRLHKKKNLKAGEYSLSASMSPLEILSIMNSGRVVQRKLTIPEGLTIYQTADLLEQNGWIEKSSFLRYCSDPEILSYWNIQGPTTEGYLFPETYFFSKGISQRQVLDIMIKQFWKVFTQEMIDKAKELNFTVHEIVTLASLIEKETALAEEKPLVSAVFHNRLKERIPLQCDPTVIYGIKDFDGNLTKRDLVTNTPYNTYTKPGLPPGPIANPGLDSLKAALYPAPVKYRYFVSKNDGTHIFSETLRQHNRAVLKFQKRRYNRL